MITSHELLSRGYFPEELPPPFSSKRYADFVKKVTVQSFDTTKHTSSKPIVFNLARAGSLRRELSILNPIHFAQLCDVIATNWNVIQPRLKSNFSLTTPKYSISGRPLSRLHELDYLAKTRAELRANGKFILFADVARFYPSIYTHSIPWVIHGKQAAKKKRHDKTLLGNKLDLYIRNCQDQQTIGIPVGPDTSLLIAELILSHVDRGLTKARQKGLRYIDDYEMVFEDEAAALKGRSILQKLLQEVELNLGPSKTTIKRLPLSLREPWIAELRRFPLYKMHYDHQKLLLAFFDRALELASQYPNQGVLKYAAARTSKLRLRHDDIWLAEDLLMQAGRVEPGSLAYALAAMLRYSTKDSKRAALRAKYLNNIIIDNAPQGHSSEVAWALWAIITLKCNLSAAATKSIVEMDDSICSILALHARELKLIKSPDSLNELRKHLDKDSLYGEKWLLAYEACVQGWFKFPGKHDFLRSDPNFSALRKAKVSFYDKELTKLTASEPDTFAYSTNDQVDDYISRIVKSYEEDDWWSYEEDDEPEED